MACGLAGEASAMTDAMVASLVQVSNHYGSRAALDDITLDVPARRMIGVIGPDGVGKSTLLALISGVRKIQDGHVTVLGGDMANVRHRTQSRGRIAYMPQGLGRNLYPTLSVFENIDFFGRLFGQSRRDRRQRIDELLKATGLDPFEKRPAGKLSGGMKQKLSLCCALIHDPDLLILDEPTTGVDPLSREQFWELIKSISARRPQMSVIVSTAYMDEAERFDWLVAMNDGKIIARGELREILQQAGETTLDAAFIALLPKELRAQYQKVELRSRPARDDSVPAIEAEGLTRRFGDFVAVDHVSFRIAVEAEGQHQHQWPQEGEGDPNGIAQEFPRLAPRAGPQIHADAGRCGVRHRDPRHNSDGKLLGAAGACIVALRRRPRHGAGVPSGVVSPGQRWYLHQVARISRSVAAGARPGLLRARLPRHSRAHSTQAGGLAWHRASRLRR